MAAKPSQLPEWNTDGTNRVEPSAGMKATGWPLNAMAVSSYFNFWQALVHAWTAYLADGNFVGAISTDDDLLVGGSAEIAGDLTVAGGLKFTTPRSKRIPAASARPAGTSPSWALNATTMLWEPSGTGALVYPVPVEFGDRIESAILWVSKLTDATVNLSATLSRINDSTGVIEVIGSSSSSANAPGVLAFTFSTPGASDSLPHQVVGDNSYFIRLFSSTGGSVDRAQGAELNYTTRP